MTVELSEEQMEELANKFMARLVKAKENHECPFDDALERKKLHAFAEASSVESAGFLGRVGRTLTTASNKLAITIVIGITLAILGIFGALAIPKMASLFTGTGP